ncbi:hypothetical protein F4809DRAFT_627834 [Biscogniauxia mediterranea]|nr:hypothetical protein F4809DRAFT_627834 [Biscogniauxia mediterranea]
MNFTSLTPSLSLIYLSISLHSLFSLALVYIKIVLLLFFFFYKQKKKFYNRTGALIYISYIYPTPPLGSSIGGIQNRCVCLRKSDIACRLDKGGIPKISRR